MVYQICVALVTQQKPVATWQYRSVEKHNGLLHFCIVVTQQKPVATGQYESVEKHNGLLGFMFLLGVL
jgi:hypothetical protein